MLEEKLPVRVIEPFPTSLRSRGLSEAEATTAQEPFTQKKIPAFAAVHMHSPVSAPEQPVTEVQDPPHWAFPRGDVTSSDPEHWPEPAVCNE